MTDQSRFTEIIEESVPYGDRAVVALYANYLLNAEPRLRPSDAARQAVEAYRADPDAIREREAGQDVVRTASE